MDKAAAKREYKEAKRPMGVYRIRNTVSGRNYVGFSTNALARMNRHKAELTFLGERCKELQKDWDSSEKRRSSSRCWTNSSRMRIPGRTPSMIYAFSRICGSVSWSRLGSLSSGSSGGDAVAGKCSLISASGAIYWPPKWGERGR